jgi:hypothetical protein
MNTVPRCRTITVHTFQGDRATIAKRVLKALDDEMNSRGPGPTVVECLLYAGHTGVSTDSDRTIYGFHPDTGQLPLSQVMQRLRKGEAFPGVVLDDTPVFAEASKHRLKALSFEVILPDPSFQRFEQKLTDERQQSRYLYGFPNGDGDCNCLTWLERLALPLLTGRMDEFTSLAGLSSYPRRRFGRCI